MNNDDCFYFAAYDESKRKVNRRDKRKIIMAMVAACSERKVDIREKKDHYGNSSIFGRG